mmetsp:Transcript_22302/g.37309  ORF Transcript_22302/g.37309 Transcript_22302/m.37309 type:complete len:305 (-) Transcript_22302:206-1120(-)|eukprot:CAMPEP_0174976178 /NCGR_PEP_ID=MMETSP0004_2-20121128/12881_1 /TAXON_ID=420556 /ORGANISM="Ochromonas sp., Strain CCMP1393" /LENGTH=304 /DNA_ID=CAMNT_0016227165 /DNA_START=87 /DNA_END=1001 /DNA_ORIENTATION=+
MVDLDMGTELDNLDIAAIVISLSLFTLYHIYLYLIAPALEIASLRPGERSKVPYLLNRLNATIWIDKHKTLHDTATTTLAIQTLRNTIVVSVFTGGYALEFAYGFANEYENVHGTPRQIRSIIIMSCLFASFLCWANVIRLASQTGFLLGSMQHLENQRDASVKAVEEEKERQRMLEIERQRSEALEAGTIKFSESELSLGAESAVSHVSKKVVAKLLSPSELPAPEDIPDFEEETTVMIKMLLLNFSFGFRLIFLSVPFAMYIIGPIALLISMLMLLIFFQLYDSRNKHDHFSLSEIDYRKMK